MNQNVFVYGSLKRGFPNHYLLSAATFISPAWTASPSFRMGNVGAYPEVTRVGTNNQHAGFVAGELYSCDPATLKRLDILEDNGVDYLRESIQVQSGPPITPLPNGNEPPTHYTAWIYLWQLEPCRQVRPLKYTGEQHPPPTIYEWPSDTENDSENRST